MRNISFMLTEPQFRARTKTVTRRLGWEFLRPGDVLMGCRKCMGLKKGEKIERLGRIRVVSVRRETLSLMYHGGKRGYGRNEASLEGFPTLTGNQFVAMFCKHMRCPDYARVTRIEFEYLD